MSLLLLPPGQAPPTVRIDKVKAHEDHIAHVRAVQKWEAARALSAPAPAPADAPGAQVTDADAALAALLRTVLTAAAMTPWMDRTVVQPYVAPLLEKFKKEEA